MSRLGTSLHILLVAAMTGCVGALSFYSSNPSPDARTWGEFAIGAARALSEQTDDAGTPVFDLYNHQWQSNHETKLVVFLLTDFSILSVAIILQYYIGKVWKLTLLPEAGGTMLLGMFVGLCVASRHHNYGKDELGSQLIDFSAPLFFIGFIPPIIFSSGFHLNGKVFFTNIGDCTSLAIVGSLVSTTFVGCMLFFVGELGVSLHLTFAEALTYGALISATDPVSTLAVFQEMRVDPTLFYLVFGESVLNDAVAIVLFSTFSKFVTASRGGITVMLAVVDFIVIFVGSTIIGIVCGWLSALLFKHVDLSARRIALLSVYVLMVYVPFLISEACELSGIVTILFTGISVARYTNHNIPHDSEVIASSIFETMAMLAETEVFLDLGMSVFGLLKTSDYHWDLIFWVVAFILIGRLLHVYPLCYISNLWRKSHKNETIPFKTQHMVWYSGLRGAVAYALSTIFPDTHHNQSNMRATTMIVVLITVFAMGGGTSAALNFLRIPKGIDYEQIATRNVSSWITRLESRYIFPTVVTASAYRAKHKPQISILEDGAVVSLLHRSTVPVQRSSVNVHPRTPSI